MKKVIIAIIYVLAFIVVFNALDYAYEVFFLKHEFAFSIGSSLITPAVAGLIMFLLFHRSKKAN